MIIDVLSSYSRSSSPNFEELLDAKKGKYYYFSTEIFKYLFPKRLCKYHGYPRERIDRKSLRGEIHYYCIAKIEFIIFHGQLFPQSTRLLSYHLIDKLPWTALENELTDISLPRLLSLAIPLELSPDEFHVTVINDLLKKIVKYFLHNMNFID